MKERRLVTVACVAIQDAPIPILSHVYAALKSRDVSFDEMGFGAITSNELTGREAEYWSLVESAVS